MSKQTRNDQTINKAVADKIGELRGRAAQQPRSYIQLYREAIDLAEAQFIRAMSAEAELHKADEATCCLRLPPEKCAEVPDRHCGGQRATG